MPVPFHFAMNLDGSKVRMALTGHVALGANHHLKAFDARSADPSLPAVHFSTAVGFTSDAVEEVTISGTSAIWYTFGNGNVLRVSSTVAASLMLSKQCSAADATIIPPNVLLKVRCAGAQSITLKNHDGANLQVLATNESASLAFNGLDWVVVANAAQGPAGPAGSGAISAASAAALAPLVGGADAAFGQLMGLGGAGDGADSPLRWIQGSSDTSDGYLTFGTSPSGRWKRLRPHSCFFNVKWFGATGDGTTDDTAAIQRALNALGPFSFGMELFFPAGTYKVSARLKVGANYPAGSPTGTTGSVPWGNVRIYGVGGTGQGVPAVTLNWYGSDHETYSGTDYPSNMLQLAGFDCLVERICFSVANNFKIGAFVNFGYFFGETVQGVTGQHIHNCLFTSGSKADGVDANNGLALHGVVFDYYNRALGNGENAQITKCTFARMQHSAIWLKNGQPFNVQVNDCYINNAGVNPLGDNHPWGIGILCSTFSSQLSVKSLSAHRISAIVVFQTPPSSCTLQDLESEWCKKLFYFPASGFGFSSTLSIIGGRYATDATANASEGRCSTTSPVDVTFLGNNGKYIESRSDLAINLIGAQFVFGFAYDSYFKIQCNSEELTVRGCVFPTDKPFAPRFACWNPDHPGRTYSEGNRGRDISNNFVRIPTLKGPANPAGKVTISGNNTYADVTLGIPEPDTTPYSVVNVPPHYMPLFSILGKSASAVVSQPYCATDLTVAGPGNTVFRVALPTAPGVVGGVDQTVTIAYDLVSV